MTRLEDVPAGLNGFHARFGVAGHLGINAEADEAEERIGRVEFGISAAGRSDWYVSIGLSNARLSIEWDLDGDTRFPNTPMYFFTNTFGGPLNIADYGGGATLRMRMGEFGLGLGGMFVADDWQLRLGLAKVWFVDVPYIKRTGLLCGALAPEIRLFGNWWPFPIVTKRTGGCV